MNLKTSFGAGGGGRMRILWKVLELGVVNGKETLYMDLVEDFLMGLL